MADLMSPSASIEKEARDLTLRLKQLETEKPTGDPVREEEEDRIYQRLFELTEAIKTNFKHGEVTPKTKEIFFMITNEPLTDAPLIKAGQQVVPNYTDKYGLYPRSTPNPKVHLFLEAMTKAGKLMEEKQFERILQDTQIDGQKELLFRFRKMCNREKSLKKCASESCSTCWKEVMPTVFLLLSQVLTTELLNRMEQVKTLQQNQDLTPADTRYLLNFIDLSRQETEAVLEQVRVKKPSSKGQWIHHIESLYLIMVRMINEIMMRYIVLLKFRATVQSGGAHLMQEFM